MDLRLAQRRWVRAPDVGGGGAGRGWSAGDGGATEAAVAISGRRRRRRTPTSSRPSSRRRTACTSLEEAQDLSYEWWLHVFDDDYEDEFNAQLPFLLYAMYHDLEVEEDEDDDADQNVPTDLSPLTSDSLKRASSTSTTGTSPAKKSESPIVRILENMLALNKEAHEQKMTMMRAQVAAAAEEKTLKEQEDVHLRIVKERALEAGVRKGSKEWFALGILARNWSMRSLFLDIETAEGRLEFIGHVIDRYMKN